MEPRESDGDPKLLRDTFGRTHTYLRVSVTDRCNLRCLYCSPARYLRTFSKGEYLTIAEITRVVRISASLGVKKVRLTGGEPLLRRDIGRLVESIALVPGLETVALTTNGVLLGREARALRSAGLSQLNISLDTLRPERFPRIAQRDAYRAVWNGIDAAVEAGFSPIRINVVVLEGINDDELLEFAELARQRPFCVRFIECMPFACSRRRDTRLVPYETMVRRIQERYLLKPAAASPGHRQVAKEFRIEGFAGTIGFITPMSSRFCSECNRLRLLADGSLKSCLFVPPAVNLRRALRAGASDAEVAELIRSVVRAKASVPSATCDRKSSRERSMIVIGG